MSRNKDLQNARKNKADEFYTLLEDIQKELNHYEQHFKNKTVLCNCDDPYESNFFKYFAINFNRLGLKKLIATCYDSSPVVGTQLSLFDDVAETILNGNKKAYKVEISSVEDFNNDGVFNIDDVELLLKQKKVVKKLKGDGDFRSKECIELLKEADIICTNPPFSLFREYVEQLVEYNKKFLIIGNINCLTYKNIFKLIMNNKVWLGNGMGRYISGFIVPQDYDLYGTEAREENGKRIVSTNNCLWLTNLEHKKRHEFLQLNTMAQNKKLLKGKKDELTTYVKYDDYDAINVDKTNYIPSDYEGIMGVPITFLDKYNPDQFEILGLDDHRVEWLGHGPSINGKTKYRRLIIRKKVKS